MALWTVRVVCGVPCGGFSRLLKCFVVCITLFRSCNAACELQFDVAAGGSLILIAGFVALGHVLPPAC